MYNPEALSSSLSVVILAGGLGTRLRQVIADRPKVLAVVGGRPFIYYLLDQINDAGIRKVILCTGYLGEMVREELGDGYRQLDLSYSQEETPKGTAGSLRLALPLIPTETVLVMNGDSFCRIDLQEFWNFHQKNGSRATIALTYVKDTCRYGKVDFDEAGKIKKFVEKAETLGAGWVSAGIYLISKARIATIPTDKPVSIEKETFPSWVKSGLYAWCSHADFIDIGTPESYSQADAYFAGERV